MMPVMVDGPDNVAGDAALAIGKDAIVVRMNTGVTAMF
jgi:hypothetical protein